MVINMDEKISAVKDLGKYFVFHSWLSENRKEIKLRLFLMDQRDRLTEDNLMKFFPKLPQEPEDKYALFIRYMSQGFNRKRGLIQGTSTENIIRNSSFQFKWTGRAKRWEDKEINLMIKTFGFDELEDDAWKQKESETNFQYFLFLTYVLLGKKYSGNTLVNILNDYGVNTHLSSIRMFSMDNSWVERRDSLQ